MNIEHFLSRYMPEPNSGCWIWLGPTFQIRRRTMGYGRYGRHGVLAHRISFELHKGSIPVGQQVCHSCDNVLCINPDHLFLGNDRINSDDKVAKNRHLKGEEIGLSKLTEAAIKHIRVSSKSNSTLAAEYGVVPATIYNVRSGRTWSWVK